MPKKIQLNREISYLISFILVCIFFSTIHLSSLGQWIYHNHDLGYFYKGRKVLGSETKIDPRLKIYLFDDITASSLKDSGISAQRWLEIFRSISKQNPKVIITPNPFNIVKNLHDPIDFTDAIRKIDTKIATGVWLTETPVPSLIPLDPEDFPSFSLKNQYGVSNPDGIRWFLATDKQMFGPNPGLMNAFAYFGGAWGYSPEVPIVSRLDEEYALGHIALHAADTISADKGSLLINEIDVPHTREGLIQINYLDPDQFYEKSKSLIEPIRQVMRGNSFDKDLTSGDVVLLLPNFRTGSTKHVNTPMGDLPEGYAIASVINSVLTGDWIQPQGLHWVFLAILGILGTLIGRITKKSRILIFLSFYFICTLLSSLFLFTSIGFAFPITLGTLTMVLTCLASLLIRYQREKIRYEEVMRLPRHIFGRKLSKNFEKSYKRLPEIPINKIVSMLHVRFDDVSSILKQLSGESLFNEFKNLEHIISEIVHQHGGIEVRTRDGRKIAYFDSSLTDNNPQNHAEQALLCAENIILEINSYLNEKLKKELPVLQVKIAVDSAPIQIGNSGDRDHLVPIILGKQVEELLLLSKELPNLKIGVGESSHSLLREHTFNRITRITTNIEDRSLTYFELDPVKNKAPFETTDNDFPSPEIN